MKLKHVLFVSTLISWAVPLHAVQPVPGLDVRQLIQDADVVVAGDIVAVSPAGETSLTIGGRVVVATRLAAHLKALDVVKGMPTDGDVLIEFTRPHEPIGFRDVQANTYRCFFLKRQSDHYEFVSPYWPSVVAAPPSNVQVGAMTAIERVTAVVGRVLTDASATEGEKMQAIDVLASVKTPAAAAAVSVALADTSLVVRLSAAAADVGMSDTKGLQIAVASLRANPRPQVPGYVLSNIRAAIANGVLDPAALETVTPLTQDAQIDNRRAGIAAVANMRSASAIPMLVRALDDLDSEIAYTAVRGLALVTGQASHMTSREQFKVDGHVYVDYWKGWALQRGIK